MIAGLDLGVCDAMNKGVWNARSDWVYSLGADTLGLVGAR